VSRHALVVDHRGSCLFDTDLDLNYSAIMATVPGEVEEVEHLSGAIPLSHPRAPVPQFLGGSGRPPVLCYPPENATVKLSE
jgi:hypothetical protein